MKDKKQKNKLTPREIEVITWTSRGKTSDEIGCILSISRETVLFHLKNIKIKLNAANKTHAVSIYLGGDAYNVSLTLDSESNMMGYLRRH